MRLHISRRKIEKQYMKAEKKEEDKERERERNVKECREKEKIKKKKISMRPYVVSFLRSAL